MERIYLDHNATTPLDPGVLEAMLPFLRDFHGNASSFHAAGRAARAAVEQARERVAGLLGAQPREIVFTSGGTEADNHALRGVVELARGRSAEAPHIVTSSIEHPAVLNTVQHLEKQGCRATYLPVDAFARVDPQSVREALTDAAVLVSVMLANNEVGSLQPLAEICGICRQRGVPIHTDAVQAAGRVPIDVGALGVDLLSISSHKIYGPKGVGALYIRRGTRVAPLIHGGHQESRRRGGTENVAGIVGLGRAAQLAGERLARAAEAEARLRDRLEQGLRAAVPHMRVHGHPTERLPNTLTAGFRFVEGEALLLNLDLEGVAVSTGSACSSGDLEPSHVLIAMGVPVEEAHGTLRFSLGKDNTVEEIDRAIAAVARVVEKVRAMSPMYHDFEKRRREGASSRA
ncbi:MAG: cysteine desulfurase NifS [Candidatus Eisenbacteria bacterium]|uniref:Cysteine desulfurase n=1 Tax=Eiseniibacteriota bacterium TaxID=2212470 RepID=A0A937XDT6_UNCEI|nr:cysteine desulfurase NifS [Candidatus Eisenbacteria bacterium]